MYCCGTCFYMMTEKDELFDALKELSPLPHFAHEYLRSAEPDEALAGRADVILADISRTQMDVRTEAL